MLRVFEPQRKKLTGTLVGVLALLVFLHVGTVRGQSFGTPITNVPLCGTFFSAQLTNQPPYAVDIFNGALPV
jgi:hypothetical protein